MAGRYFAEKLSVPLTIFFCAAFIIVGRFTVETRELTGWPGSYEAFAHILLGIVIGISWLAQERAHRIAAGVVFYGTSFFELWLVMRS